MKNILFVIDALEFGGGERCFAQLMAGLPADRYEKSLASSENTRLRGLLPPRVRVFPLDFSRRLRPALLKELKGIIQANAVNIVHAQGARAEFYARLASRGMPGVRYVSTVAMPVEGFDVGWIKKNLYCLFDRLTDRYVDRFIVVSDALKEEICRRRSIPSERIVRIYNGVETDLYDPARFTAVRDELRREFDAGGYNLLGGAVGRLVWQKGFKYLLQGLAGVLRDHPSLKFLLVGEGPLRGELEALSRELGISARVVFTGERKDIAAILAALDLVVVPSVLEGFPMVTLEAMAMERPIVATAIPGIIEQITDGKEGLLVPPEDPAALGRAIARLVDDPSLGRRLGQAARQKVEAEFSVKRMVEETMRVYEGLH